MATEKQNNNDSEFEKVEDVYAEPWKDMKKGESIQGTYLGFREVDGANNRSFNAHVLQQRDGKLSSVAGGSLEARLARVPEGASIRITFEGTQKHKGNNMKLFSLDIAKGTKLLPIRFEGKRKMESGDESDSIPV